MKKLEKKIIYKGTIKLLTGLHIGGSKEGMEIGGVDSVVIKDPISDIPYIPGSSLKGKLRSLIQQSEGVESMDFNEKVGSSLLFGGTAKRNNDNDNTKSISRTSRVIFRDSFMEAESIRLLENKTNMDMPHTEIKWENTIDRVEGKAKDGGLRQTERVPSGVTFNLSFVLNKFEDEQTDYVKMLKDGFRMLEADYLGGSGTRGYGQVKVNIDWDNPEVLDTQNLV